MAKRTKTPETIDPNEIRTRDYLLLSLILGSCKAGVRKDRKKEKARKRCREKVSAGEE